MKKSDYIVLFLIIVSFALAIYLYPSMPGKMPTHWNSKGVVDGYSSKALGLFLMPSILVFIWLLFYFIPKVAVYKNHFKQHEKEYNSFKVIIALFLFILYIVTILATKGYKFNMNYVVMTMVAFLFYFIGTILPNIKRNYFFGIRTPWALSSDKVWNATHIMGGKIFKAFALLFLITMFLPKGIWIMLSGLLLGIIYLFYYSYSEFKKK